MFDGAVLIFARSDIQSKQLTECKHSIDTKYIFIIINLMKINPLQWKCLFYPP